MFSGLLKNQPLLDEETVEWLLDTFAWAIGAVGARPGGDRPVLVLPTNRYFPGRADSVDGMADLVFRKVAEYAGMGDWPLRPAAGNACAIPPTLTGSMPHLPLLTPSGDMLAVFATTGAPAGRVIAYDPALVGNPEALIASFAHSLAAIRAERAGSAPPGGAENLACATEVLAVVMGFGVMLANSARTVQVRSCGSCSGGRATRQSSLSAYDTTYALAISCLLEEIPGKTVAPHLDKPLRPFFKRAIRDAGGRRDDLAALQDLSQRRTDASPGRDEKGKLPA